MRQVLGSSIFYSLLLVLLSEPVFAQTAVLTNLAKTQVQGKSIPDLSFLSQAEDIEREAWWVITNDRLDGSTSPFRILLAAVIQMDKKQKTKMNYRFCKKLEVIQQSPLAWRVEAACQKPSIEIGSIQKLTSLPDKWKISWKSGPFSDHFGLSTSALYSQQSCEIEVSKGNRITHLSCPHYVRDRKIGEIAEFVIFEYRAQAPAILKIEGEIKKDLHPIATFKTEVPMSGDIVVKIKKIPQKTNLEADGKPVANKTEFSNISGPTQAQGESNGESTRSQENEEIKDPIHEEKNQSDHEEEVRPIEVPPISAPPSR